MAVSYLGQAGLSRGIANNNPGNLVISNNDWEGKIPLSQNTDGTFEQFTDIDYGTRAMALNAIDIIKANNDTLAQYITTYAPPSENDTSSYINDVSGSTGIPPNAVIADNLDAVVLASILRAQITMENGSDGNLVTDQDIADSINLLPALILSEIGTLIKQNEITIAEVLTGVAVIWITIKVLT